MSKAKRKSSAPLAAKSTARAAPQPLPLGFASIFGLLAHFSLCGVAFISPYLFSGFWPSSYEYWPQALFLALTATTCVLLALEPRPKFKVQRSKTEVFLALFLAWCILSVFVTVYLHDSLLELARVAGVVAWFFIARALLGDEENFARRALWLLASIIAGGAFICVPAILDFLKTHNPRQFGTFYNPNLFANYGAMALPLAAAGVLAWWRSESSSAKFKTAAGVVGLLIVALGLIVTSSKGGFIAALCAMIVFTLAVFRAKGEHLRGVLRARRGVFLAAALVMLLGGGVLFTKTILPRLSRSEEHSTMFRYYTWRGTLRMAAARPALGFGPGSFPSAYTRYAETGYTRTAHQLWLQLAAEQGFPAMLLLLFACGESTRAAWRTLRTENWPFAAGTLGAITAFFIHGLTDAGWSIISIATLAMMVLALAETGNGKQETQSSIVKRQSSINWFWLLAALPLALGSWITQRAQTGEDLRSESRELMARGAPSSALEKAHAAVEVDKYNARLWTNFAQTQEALGHGAQHAYEEAMILQETRGLNWLNLVEYCSNKRGLEDSVWFEKRMNGGVRFDPNDTTIRLARGKWRLSLKIEKGWQDIEYIAALKDKPYGKYPATPEMVDLNYARAYAMLAERDIVKDKTAAKRWIQRGLEVITEGRKYEPSRQQMEQATQGSIDYSREQTMDELQAKLKALQEKLK